MSGDAWVKSEEAMDVDSMVARIVSEMPADVMEAFERSVGEGMSASDIVGIIEGGVTDIFADILSAFAEENPDAVEDLLGYSPVWEGDELVGWSMDGETIDTAEMSQRVAETNPFLIDDFCEGFDGSVDAVDLVINAPDGLYQRMMGDWIRGMAESDPEGPAELTGGGEANGLHERGGEIPQTRRDTRVLRRAQHPLLPQPGLLLLHDQRGEVQGVQPYGGGVEQGRLSPRRKSETCPLPP